MIRNGGKLILDINSKLLIDYSTIIEYYNGAEIISYGDNAEIILRGTIKMMDGGIFEIKQFGSNAGKLILEGMAGPSFLALAPSEIKLYGQYEGDSFIEIGENSQLHIYNYSANLPHQFTKIEISDCQVVLMKNAKIRIEQPFYTFKTHFVSDQPNLGITTTDRTRFNRSIFTDVSILAPLSLENVARILVFNCTLQKTFDFQNQQEALLNIKGVGFNVYNSVFKGKSLYCIKSQSLTFPSFIRECQFSHNDLIESGNSVQGIGDNSNVEIKVYKSKFHHLYAGIVKNSGKLSVKCSEFKDNQFYNIFATNHCMINMSTDDYAGYNSFYSPTSSSNIGLSLAKLHVQNGRNYFEPSSNFYFEGTLDNACGVNTDCSINAANNQWNVDLSVPLSSKFQLFGTDNLQFMVSASLTALLPTCGAFDGNVNGTLGNNSTSLPVLSTTFDNAIRLDKAVLYGMSKMEVNDSLGDDLIAISVFNEIFRSRLNKSNKDVKFYLDYTLDLMKNSLENAISNNKIISYSDGFDDATNMYVSALNYMTDSTINRKNLHQQFDNELDKAHLFRILGTSRSSNLILEELEKCGLEYDQQFELNNWKRDYLYDLVINEFGNKLLDTIIMVDTLNFVEPISQRIEKYNFGLLIVDFDNLLFPNCDGTRHQLADFKESSHSSIRFYPNPASETLNFDLNELKDDRIESIRVFSLQGIEVYSLFEFGNTNNLDLLEIDVRRWLNGIYFYEVETLKNQVFKGKIEILH